MTSACSIIFESNALSEFSKNCCWVPTSKYVPYVKSRMTVHVRFSNQIAILNSALPRSQDLSSLGNTRDRGCDLICTSIPREREINDVFIVKGSKSKGKKDLNPLFQLSEAKHSFISIP